MSAQPDQPPDLKAEAQYIFQNGGSAKDAIELLGIGRTTAYRWLAEWRDAQSSPSLEAIAGGGGIEAELNFAKRQLKKLMQGEFEDPDAAAISLQAIESFIGLLSLDPDDPDEDGFE